LKIPGKNKNQIQPTRPNSTQPNRGRPRCLTGGPHLSATTRVHARALSLPLSLPLPGGTNPSTLILSRARPFSLAAQWYLPISADRPFARSPSLACGPRMSATTPSLTSRLCSPPWTHPRPHVSRPCPHTPESFSGARTHSLAPLAQLRP
jgi:hypothetical protein